MTRALPVLVFAVSFLFAYGPDALRMSLPGALAISAAAAGAVWLSGRRPGAALVLVVALACGLPLVDATFPALDLVVVLVGFRAAADCDLSPVRVSAGVLGALTVHDTWQRVATQTSFARPSVLTPLLLTALAVGLGLQTRHVRAQHNQLLALRDADRRRATSDERRRIARDLHDVAAHHLSAIVVRNGLARRVATVEALEGAADFTGRTAADTLTALRQVVRVLGTEDRAPLAPSPALTDLDAVVTTVRAAGLEVERPARELPVLARDVEVAVVRIAQEALSNVLRHRGPGRCRLDLVDRDGAVELTVLDDGPGRPGGGTSGYGLIGMRERAEACGGQLEAGPSDGGGWRVRAVLPAR